MNITDLDADQLDKAAEIASRTEGLCLLPLGFGKTVVMLTAFEWMRQYYGPWRMTVVSTKAIVEQTWAEEVAKWDHVSHYQYFAPRGRDTDAVKFLRPDILGINFNNLLWYLDVLDENPELTPEIIVFDESDAMKNSSTKRVSRFIGLRRTNDAPGVRRGYVHKFKRRFAMTATPNPEDYMDLWAQEACISTRRRLGLNLTEARGRYCHGVATDFGTKYEVTPTGERLIEQRLEPITIVSERQNYMGDTPPPIEQEVSVPWSRAARDEYEQMEQLFELRFGISLEEAVVAAELEEDSDVDAENTGVMLNKLRQMCSGFVFDGDSIVHETQDAGAKFGVLQGLLDVPTIIFTQYVPEREYLQQRLPGAHVGLPRDLNAWSRNPTHLLLHPKSAGAGVNLQYGSHRVVFYSLPWGSRDYTQAVGRVHRRGQDTQVEVYRLTRPDSIEQYVWKKIQRKLDRQDRFINNIRALKGYT